MEAQVFKGDHGKDKSVLLAEGNDLINTIADLVLREGFAFAEKTKTRARIAEAENKFNGRTRETLTPEWFKKTGEFDPQQHPVIKIMTGFREALIRFEKGKNEGEVVNDNYKKGDDKAPGDQVWPACTEWVFKKAS